MAKLNENRCFLCDGFLYRQVIFTPEPADVDGFIYNYREICTGCEYVKYIKDERKTKEEIDFKERRDEKI